MLKATLYVGSGVLNRCDKGWLCLNSVSDRDIDVIYGTKIRILDDRYICIDEGMLDGTVCLIPKNLAQLKLHDMVVEDFHYAKNPVELVYLRSKGEILLNGVMIGAMSLEGEIEPGIYRIELPRYKVNDLPGVYSNEVVGGARFASVWFRLLGSALRSSEVFFHFGTYSEGCLTFLYNKSSGSGRAWDGMVLELLRSRLGEVYVGTLQVSD